MIGGGHNGLVAAAYLAKAGLKVIVLERRAVIGGAAATEELIPGIKFNTGSNDAGLFLPRILDDLNLQATGALFIDPAASIYQPQPGGLGLVMWRDIETTCQEISRLSQRDADAYPRFQRLVSRLAQVLKSILTLTPPALPNLSLSEIMTWLPSALRAKRLGSQDLRQLLRVLPMSAADFLDEWFETPGLKGLLGYAGVMGTFLGPRASGTAFQLIYQAIGAGDSGIRTCRFVRGGTGALSDALASVARQFGAEIVTACQVTSITLTDGNASGVELANGERISCPYILSSTDPRGTFFRLIGAENLPLRFVREVKNIKFRGSTARINMVINSVPDFKDSRLDTNHLQGHILLCQDLDELERAYDNAKYGSFPSRPVLDLVMPTLSDNSLAPPGSHILSVDVRYAPYHLSSASWDEQRGKLEDLVVRILSEYSPGIASTITHTQVITPLDYEREYALSEGSIYHGQMGLDQMLFMRPVAGSRGSHTLIPGLFLCGAGAHPGGGVTGAPGYNAARQVLASLRKSNW